MAIGIDNTKPDSVNLEILTLVNNEGEGFDIRDLMIECAINESITTNFLMGHLIIGDSINLLENAKIFGQESLRVRFSQPAGINDETHEDDLIDQIFRIYKVEDVHRYDESTQFFKLYFTSCPVHNLCEGPRTIDTIWDFKFHHSSFNFFNIFRNLSHMIQSKSSTICIRNS